MNIVTSFRRKRQGHTAILELLCVFLDLFFADAVLEDYDEGYWSGGLISIVPCSLDSE